jgi:arylsulfatase A-like enzyme
MDRAPTQTSRKAQLRRLVTEWTPEDGATEPAPGPIALMALAVWFGLVTGLLELALLLARQRFFHAAALGALQMNRHFLWMVPASSLLIFGACGLPLGLVARRWPRPALRLACYLLVTLALLALLLTIQGLYAVACVVLAVGLATRVAPRIEARAGQLRRLVRYSLPVFCGVVAVLALLSYHRVVLAERRALADLPPTAPGAPNVLLIVLDTLRADHLSPYGYKRDTTPNLARLAAQGVRFERARSTAPWTLPSHASLFTGRWPHELSATLECPLDATHPTLAEFLRDHGYVTAGFVANTFFCNSWYGLGRGFVHYEDYYQDNLVVSPEEVLRSSALGRRLLQVIGTATNTRPGVTNRRKDAARINDDFLGWHSAQGGRPFFAFLNYIDTHDPYTPPAGFDRHFGLRPETPADVATLQAWDQLDKTKLSPRQIALACDAYDDCLAYLDEQLGRLFAELGRRGVLDRTLVIVTSDHGEHLGEHRIFGHARSLYRPELDVPLLMVAPSGVPTGATVAAPVSLRDLPATIAERLGLGAASPFPGTSLARLWDPALARARSTADPVFSEVAVQTKVSRKPHRAPALRGPMTSLVADGTIYIRNADGREELYDLDDDPAEARDLSGSADAAPILGRFRQSLERLRKH